MGSSSQLYTPDRDVQLGKETYSTSQFSTLVIESGDENVYETKVPKSSESREAEFWMHHQAIEYIQFSQKYFNENHRHANSLNLRKISQFMLKKFDTVEKPSFKTLSEVTKDFAGFSEGNIDAFRLKLETCPGGSIASHAHKMSLSVLSHILHIISITVAHIHKTGYIHGDIRNCTCNLHTNKLLDPEAILFCGRGGHPKLAESYLFQSFDWAVHDHIHGESLSPEFLTMRRDLASPIFSYPLDLDETRKPWDTDIYALGMTFLAFVNTKLFNEFAKCSALQFRSSSTNVCLPALIAKYTDIGSQFYGFDSLSGIRPLSATPSLRSYRYPGRNSYRASRIDSPPPYSGDDIIVTQELYDVITEGAMHILRITLSGEGHRASNSKTLAYAFEKFSNSITAARTKSKGVHSIVQVSKTELHGNVLYSDSSYATMLALATRIAERWNRMRLVLPTSGTAQRSPQGLQAPSERSVKGIWCTSGSGNDGHAITLERILKMGQLLQVQCKTIGLLTQACPGNLADKSQRKGIPLQTMIRHVLIATKAVSRMHKAGYGYNAFKPASILLCGADADIPKLDIHFDTLYGPTQEAASKELLENTMSQMSYSHTIPGIPSSLAHMVESDVFGAGMTLLELLCPDIYPLFYRCAIQESYASRGSSSLSYICMPGLVKRYFADQASPFYGLKTIHGIRTNFKITRSSRKHVTAEQFTTISNAIMPIFVQTLGPKRLKSMSLLAGLLKELIVLVELTLQIH